MLFVLLELGGSAVKGTIRVGSGQHAGGRGLFQLGVMADHAARAAELDGLRRPRPRHGIVERIVQSHDCLWAVATPLFSHRDRFPVLSWVKAWSVLNRRCA